MVLAIVNGNMEKVPKWNFQKHKVPKLNFKNLMYQNETKVKLNWPKVTLSQRINDNKIILVKLTIFFIHLIVFLSAQKNPKMTSNIGRREYVVFSINVVAYKD